MNEEERTLWDQIDRYILADNKFSALKLIRDRFGFGIIECEEAYLQRFRAVSASHPVEMAALKESRSLEAQRRRILSEAERMPPGPAAIEVLWDGDSSGWFVCLAAIYRESRWFRKTRYKTVNLGCLRGESGDMRLFNGQVPPWPEARLAQLIGHELANRFGAMLYFPSPDYPEDQCPRWWDCDRGYPCQKCGILLLQRDPCPWKGVCYHCHLADEKVHPRPSQ